jgi:hypothetical protein
MREGRGREEENKREVLSMYKTQIQTERETHRQRERENAVFISSRRERGGSVVTDLKQKIHRISPSSFLRYEMALEF